MSRRNPELVAPTGLLDGRAPIITVFEDGREVSEWMRIVRGGGTPPVDLLDQLKAAGWRHIAISKVEEIVDHRARQPIGYAAVSSSLSRHGCELEVEATDTNGNKFQMALCSNEYTLLHGQTINQRGPERRTRLKMATMPGVFGGLLLATR